MLRTTGTDAPGKRFAEGLPTHRLGDLALFVLLGLAAGAHLLAAFADTRHSEAPSAVHHLVVGVALAINASLFILRGPAIARAEALAPKVIALVGSWMLPPLSLLPITQEATWLLTGSTVAIFLAYAFVIWALLTLRNSFSVFPEARQLVRHGPYRLVRHPLYAAYIVTYLAMLLPRISLVALLVAAVGIGAEVWRARYEERLLGSVFPDYATYSTTTPRFVPGSLMLSKGALRR